MSMPHWEVEFDHAARPVDAAAHERVVEEIADGAVRDLFVFSHGWNNSPVVARRLYDRYFGGMEEAAGHHGIDLERVASLRIIWPSILWPDEEEGAEEDSAAAGPGASVGPPGEAREYEVPAADLLNRVFAPGPVESAAAAAVQLLESGLETPADRSSFVRLIRQLFDGDPADDAEAPAPDAVLALEADDLLKVFARHEPAWDTDGESGAAGLGDAWSRITRGARGALRTASYWTMKARAGVVGRNGLAPLLRRLHAGHDDLRVHLGGHSFGARVVSYSLSGLHDDDRFVRSLFLVQGAFSHSAFAPSLPFDRTRQGALAGEDRRVHGPRVVTFSSFDTAVGRAYPLASLLGGQDAANLSDRWGAIGARGALGVSAGEMSLRPAGTPYPFQAGRWYNLNGYDVIRNGGPPSGAHSDIFHPEVAWAALSAAQLAPTA